MTIPAIVLCPDSFRIADGKTAHGLVRGSERFHIKAVVDASCAGQDAGELLDGRHRDVPVFADPGSALIGAGPGIRTAIIGMATHGGKLTDALLPLLEDCMGRGLDIVNGLHDSVSAHSRLGPLARAHGITVTDLRTPPPLQELHFWEGRIAEVKTPRIAVLGTDCSVGKRTTARALTLGLRQRGLCTEMIYTGQTGWMQGGDYGIILDCLPNDYVSGELEHAVVRCHRERNPDVMIIEGQAALRNPSGPCGAELLVSARAEGVILQHAPARRYFDGHEDYDATVPGLGEEIALIGMYGSRVIGVALSEEGSDPDEMLAFQRQYARELGLPVVRPAAEGIEALVDASQGWMGGKGVEAVRFGKAWARAM